MTRLTRFAALFGSLALAYMLAWMQVFHIPLVDAMVEEKLLPVLPWWLLITFGSYSLASLGWGLYTFNDVPKAYEELLKDISDAKNDLRVRGVATD